MKIDEIVNLLNEATGILTENIPDMDVSEWNKTPIGRAVKCIEAAMEKVVSDED